MIHEDKLYLTLLQVKTTQFSLHPINEMKYPFILLLKKNPLK